LHPSPQEAIAAAGGLEVLLSRCKSSDTNTTPHPLITSDLVLHTSLLTRLKSSNHAVNRPGLHPSPQEAIAAAGGLEVLLDRCKSSDTDVIECATAGLANLAAMFEPNAVRIGQLGGVEILAGKIIHLSIAMII
jgi:hypothetical protein